MKCDKCNGKGEIPSGEELRERREHAGVPQGELAALMGVSQSYLCDLEQGRRDLNAEIVAKFSAALKKKAA